MMRKFFVFLGHTLPVFLFLNGAIVESSDRKTKLNFDGDLVEGVHKKATNYLLINKRKQRKRTHLYRRVFNFEREKKETERRLDRVQ